MHSRGQKGRVAAVLLLASASASAGAAAAQPDAAVPGEGFDRRGLELVLRSLETGSTDARVARLAALYVPHGEAPSPFIDAGPFEATFRGAIALDLNDSFRFLVRGNGGVRLSIGGEVVLERETLPADGSPAASDGEIRLSKGLNAIELVYRSSAQGDAALRLNWANDYLPEEPLPPESLWRSDSPELDRGLARRIARNLVADAMCVRCHPAAGSSDPPVDAMPELAATGPDLDGIGSRLRRRWIEQWLLDPGPARSGARMPRLLSTEAEVARQQAADLAAYLTASSTDDRLTQTAATTPTGSLSDGRRVYAQIGCAACHGAEDSRPPIQTAPPLVAAAEAPTGPGTGEPAFRLQEKWRPPALTRYLLDPTELDPWSRMPRTALGSAEAGSLAVYLLTPASEGGAAPSATGSSTAPEAPIQGDPERGRRLADELRCRSCHALGGGDPPPPAAPIDRLAGGVLVWTGSGNADSNHPRYDLNAAQSEAIERLLADSTSSLTRRAPVEFAERRIRGGGCLACHARDGDAASWSPPAPAADDDAVQDGLAFFTETGDETGPDRLPPALTWAGEKLRSDWLEDFVAGRLDDRPRPHLRARMPAFSAHADILSEGLHHQHGLPASLPDDDPDDPELAAIGRDLIRGDRLGCHSCHALGDEPALGAEGSEETINFALVRRRLRRQYFDRFLRDPQRILPGSKMPQFVDEDGYTGLYDVLGGEAERQFEAIWQYLRTLD